MEDKKVMKITLLTIFVIIAIITIITICIMGLYIYNSNNEKVTVAEKVRELNSKVTLLESNELQSSNATNEITKNNVENTIDSTKKVYSYSDIKGEYEGEREDGPGVSLVLFEDGTFNYWIENFVTSGNYIIVDNTIILNEIFEHGGGVGLDVIKGEKKLAINDDTSIMGNFLNSENSPIILKKTASSTDGNLDIREHMKSSLGNDYNDLLEFKY